MDQERSMAGREIYYRPLDYDALTSDDCVRSPAGMVGA